MRGRAYWQAQAEAKDLIIHELRVQLKDARERIGELEDAAKAQTLAELRTFRPVAMQAEPEPDDARDWGADPTGLFVAPLPPLTAEEQRQIDAGSVG